MRKKRSLGLKSNIALDFLLVGVLLFVFILVTFFSYKAYSDIMTDLQADTTEGALNFSEPAINTTIEATYTKFPSIMDGAIVFLFFGLWAGVMILAFMIDTHPLFFVLAVLLLIIVVIVFIFLGNTYEETFADTDIDTMPSMFPMSNWIMTHILYLAIGMIFTIGLAVYGKNFNR